MEKTKESGREFRQGDSGPKYLFRGPHAEWGIIRLNPGQKMGPHGHRKVVEDFFCLEGNPTLLVNGRPEKMEPGDVIRLEPLEMHDIHNDTGQAARLLFIKAPYLPEDKITP